jgi:hypothetical protein
MHALRIGGGSKGAAAPLHPNIALRPLAPFEVVLQAREDH